MTKIQKFHIRGLLSPNLNSFCTASLFYIDDNPYIKQYFMQIYFLRRVKFFLIVLFVYRHMSLISINSRHKLEYQLDLDFD